MRSRWPIPRAKTAIPRLPASFVSRDAVRRGLDHLVSEFPVTLVCAPAGYGKTLLLADWVETADGLDKIWVTLDSDDNNPERFWAAVVSALRAQDGGHALGGLSMARGSDTASLLANVIDGVAGLPGPVHLVLDDLHEVFSNETLHGIGSLIQHQPDNLRLVLST